ncbi:hypothetical protein GC089_01045 [Cellulomonas sp. JZ18]|uniref:hypothetical protein n=1 Tax=Cellulomonas sp. JZ18 TaxID=2654191 RepID=UPI0012D41F6B|nr:hypothetical protein [Cellulomonas sp. JZ18]QGQ18110.1 hypothetical protein GC089_01045 [Cellulomonas sp. JZ18]
MAVPEPAPEMARNDHRGAVAAGRHFMALRDHAVTYQDERHLAPMCSPESRWCEGAVAVYKRWRLSSDDPQRTMSTTVLGTRAGPHEDGVTWTVELDVERFETVTHEDVQTGAVTLEAAAPLVMTVYLELRREDDGRWVVLAHSWG